jgi:1-phosphofructokinase family hexose kinase
VKNLKMILIVTLNPLLERRFIYKQINLGSVNRNSITSITAGGKGINVSRQLNKFGVKSYNLIFSGGTNGKIYRDSLKNEELDFSFIHIKSETRNAAIIISEKDKKTTSYFSEDPIILESEVAEFKSRLEKMIENCELVIFSGNSPCAATDSIIPYGIELANKHDKVSICDTYGNCLPSSLKAAPTMLHNNISEIEKSIGIKLTSEKSILEFLDHLYAKNIKRVFLTDGSNNFYASNFDYFYKIKPLQIKEIDATGSGDSFVAGIAYSWLQADVFEDVLKLSTAIAGLNATSFDVSKVNLDEAIKLKDKIKVLSVGKKIKLIDDSPREI